MKRTGCMLVFLLILAFLAQPSAVSEAVPDGSCYSVYNVRYDKTALEGWQTVKYFEPSGLLFSAFTEDAEITVSVNERGSADSPEAYLKNYQANVSRYGRIVSADEIAEWMDPTGSAGAKVRYQYMYSAGSETDDIYETHVYASRASENTLLVIVLNTWSQESGRIADHFENEFLPGFGVETIRVSTVYTAYLKGISGEDGALNASVDFCSVEFDANILSVYTVNEEPEEYVYRISPDAAAYGPDLSSPLYSMKSLDITRESLERAVQDYSAKNGIEGIYQLVFNERNEIIWMMHYNAY